MTVSRLYTEYLAVKSTYRLRARAATYTFWMTDFN